MCRVCPCADIDGQMDKMTNDSFCLIKIGRNIIRKVIGSKST